MPITDDGLLRGDGVFEVVRLYGGVPYALDEHLERMANSAENLRLPFDASSVRGRGAGAARGGRAPATTCCAWSARAAARASSPSSRCPPVPETLALITIRYSPTRVHGRHQVALLRREHARHAASRRSRAATRRLLVTPHGRVLEGPRQSFVASLDGETLVTPPLDDHVLDSITRKRLLESGPRRPSARSRPTSCRSPTEAFLASTTREVHAVAFDRRRRAARGAGPADAAGRRGDPRGDRRRGAPARGMNVLTVIGNRPQFVKAAAVSRLLRERHEELLVHTGQHYDDELSAIFVRELGIPPPERELGIGGGSNAQQTARMLEALAPLIAERRARRGARLRRHQLDARRRARRGAGAGAGRARRGGHALVRPRDAGGAQPRPDRPRRRDLLLCPSQVAAANLRREGVVGPRRGRRRRDGRRRASSSGRARWPTTRRCARPASSPASTCS